jgi:molybdate transport system substrate-binding protein
MSLFGRDVCAESVTVAVASNFTSAMNDIVLEFEKNTAHQVKLVSGSSGKIFTQINNGAPFQVFFSADQDKPRALEKAGLIVPASRFTYAIGTLVLWSNTADSTTLNASILKHGRFDKLAIANPRLSPYGAASVEVLHNLGIFDAVGTKLVMGENITQTYHFISTGNVELGFVARSQLMHNGQAKQGTAWAVPGDLHTPIHQDAVLLLSGRDSKAARELLNFVRGAKAKSIIEAHGYQTKADTQNGIL